MNPGLVEETGKVATGVIESLKTQPLLLALVIMNTVVFGAVVWSAQQQRTIQSQLTERDKATITRAMELLAVCVSPDVLKQLLPGEKQ